MSEPSSKAATCRCHLSLPPVAAACRTAALAPKSRCLRGGWKLTANGASRCRLPAASLLLPLLLPAASLLLLLLLLVALMLPPLLNAPCLPVLFALPALIALPAELCISGHPGGRVWHCRPGSCLPLPGVTASQRIGNSLSVAMTPAGHTYTYSQQTTAAHVAEVWQPQACWVRPLLRAPAGQLTLCMKITCQTFHQPPSPTLYTYQTARRPYSSGQSCPLLLVLLSLSTPS